MLKKIVFIGISLLITLSFAQAPDTLWTRTYGGVDFDDGYCVLNTTDGGYILAVYGIVAGDTTSVIKVDSMGNIMWTKYYQTTEVEVATDIKCIQQTADSGYIMTGNTNLNNGDILFIKTDSLGDTTWTRTYGGYLGYDYGHEGYQTADGGYIVLGGYYDDYIPYENYRITLTRTDSLGNSVWCRVFGGEGTACGRRLLITADNGYIVLGKTAPTIDDYHDVYIIKTDSLGEMIWSKTYGGNSGESAGSIIIDSDGGYAIAANSQSYGGAWLLRIDDNGDTLWTKVFSGKGFSSLQQTNNSSYILCGRENNDLLLMKTDPVGDTVWTRNYGGQNREQANDIRITVDSGYIVIGYTESYGAGTRDIWLLRIAPDTIGIKEQNETTVQRSILSSIFTGPLQLPKDKPYKIFDITGTVVTPQHIKPGIYFIEVDGEIRQKVIKIK